MNNNINGFEKILQDKLKDYEFPYSGKEWASFEKKLPKAHQPFLSPRNLLRFIVIPASIIVITLAIYFVNNHATVPGMKEKSLTERQNYTLTHEENPDVTLNTENKNTGIDQVFITSHDMSDDHTTKSGNADFPKPSKKDNAVGSESTKTNLQSIKSADHTSIINTAENKKNVAVQGNKQNISSVGDIINVDIIEGCSPLKVQFKPLVNSDTISYLWSFGDGKKSAMKAPSHIYTQAGSYKVTLTLKSLKSNHAKKFTFKNDIIVKQKPKAKFENSVNKETDLFTYTDNSDNALYWNWSFGDKATAKEQNPHHEYLFDGTYNVQLIVANAEGCYDTTTTSIRVTNRRPFTIANGFAPNDPYYKDYGPIGENLNPEDYKMCIYSESGNMIFKSTSLDNKWDGKITSTNKDAPSGVYIWIISMKNKHDVIQEWYGNVTLIR